MMMIRNMSSLRESALTLMLLRLADLPRRLCEIFLLDIFPAGRREELRSENSATSGEVVLPIVSYGEHASLRHDVPQVCPVEPIRELVEVKLHRQGRSIAKRTLTIAS